MNGHGPLSGVRVVDLSRYGTGPYCTLILSLLGAEVIKVESQPFAGRERLGPRIHTWADLNFNKKSCLLNLKSPRGAELLKRLIAVSDIVAENFRPGVMRRLGLDQAELRREYPGLIVVSTSTTGSKGDSSQSGYAGLFGALGGLSSITGYDRDSPVEMRFPMDMTCGLAMAFSTLAALVRRRRTGRGSWVDIAAQDAISFLSAEALLDAALNDRDMAPKGNHNETMAPHNVYPCAGSDQWISIAVGTDDEWKALVTATGIQGLTEDERFSDGYRRLRNQDALDAIIAGWTRGQDKMALAQSLQRVGVAAMPSNSNREFCQDEQVRSRDLFIKFRLGQSHSYALGLPWRSPNGQPPEVAAPPEPGEHNEHVFREILGLTEAEFFEAIETRAIA